MLNPNTHDSPSIMIRYKEYSNLPIVFPKLDYVLEVASKEMESVSYVLYLCVKVCIWLDSALNVLEFILGLKKSKLGITPLPFHKYNFLS